MELANQAFVRYVVCRVKWLSVLAETVEWGLRVQKIRSLVPSQVKLMTYQIANSCFLGGTWH